MTATALYERFKYSREVDCSLHCLQMAWFGYVVNVQYFRNRGIAEFTLVLFTRHFL
jgi:hypothetical protein